MLRGLIYDVTLRPLTRRWYREVLARLPDGAHMLDVGVGTGGALCGNARLLQEKKLRVTGIDIDKDYLKRARKRMQDAHLEQHVDLLLESVYDHRGGPYDAVYFSASFMLLPEPEHALRHVSTLLKPEGRVFFTQTFNEHRSTLLEKTKPLLRKLTTIEFGRVTYEDDFRHTLEEGGLMLEELTTMDANVGHTFRLAVAARPSAPR